MGASRRSRPLQPSSRPPFRPFLEVLSWIGAFSPVLSLGLFTPFLFGIYAARIRTPLMWATAGWYVALAVVMAVTAGGEGAADAVFGVALALNMVGGTVHALALRRRVLYGPSDFTHPPAQPQSQPRGRSRRPEAPGKSGQVAGDTDPMVAAALARRERREQARHILATDPQLARELTIGRPDLATDYDDGGLVDVNHVAVDALTRLPRIDQELAERLAAREPIGGYTSAEDMIVYADIPHEIAQEIKEFAIFRYRAGARGQV